MNIRPVHVTKFAQDNLHVFSCSDDKTVRYWDIPTEQEILNMGAHTVSYLLFHRDLTKPVQTS